MNEAAVNGNIFSIFINCLLVTGGFMLTILAPFSINPATIGTGPTGNENRGGLRPRATHGRHDGN